MSAGTRAELYGNYGVLPRTGRKSALAVGLTKKKLFQVCQRGATAPSDMDISRSKGSINPRRVFKTAANPDA